MLVLRDKHGAHAVVELWHGAYTMYVPPWRTYCASNPRSVPLATTIDYRSFSCLENCLGHVREPCAYA